MGTTLAQPKRGSELIPFIFTLLQRPKKIVNKKIIKKKLLEKASCGQCCELVKTLFNVLYTTVLLYLWFMLKREAFALIIQSEN